MRRTMGRIAAAALFVAFATSASAAEIKVFSTIGVQAALEELAPKFEKETGNKLTISWATAAILVKRVQAGESADLYILTTQSLDALKKDQQGLARLRCHVRQFQHGRGGEKGRAEARHFDARCLQEDAAGGKGDCLFQSGLRRGASGVFFAKSLDRMGIADAMKAKTHHPPPSGNAANLVVSGEAELAIQQEPEVMSVAGVDVVGPPPGDLNNITLFGRRQPVPEPKAA